MVTKIIIELLLSHFVMSFISHEFERLYTKIIYLIKKLIKRKYQSNLKKMLMYIIDSRRGFVNKISL